MGTAVDRSVESVEAGGGVGCVYVQEHGGRTHLWKVGKAKDYARRVKAHKTMSVERLAPPYAVIETEHYSKIETFLKHLLQGYRWVQGDGTELYQAERDVIDKAVTAARKRAAGMPRLIEAEALKAQPSDGTVLTPDAAVMELYRERLRLKQVEWEAHHEGERIDAELMLIMQAASELEGVASFASVLTRAFDGGRFLLDHPDLYQSYTVVRHTRPFGVRW